MSSCVFASLVYLVTLMVGIKNPFSYSLLLVLLAIISGGVLGAWVSAWSLYCVVLIFLGGMMVMLLYISTFSSDPKIKFHLSWIFGWSVGSCLFPMKVPYSHSWYIGKTDLVGIYGLSGGATFLGAVYLLIILICIVKLSESFKGSLTLTSF
uniref:NADH dehydrogenase subunit 6 n=1 Tax=Tigriopus japonicus TaxID=158387 RepID=Q8M6U2_TIGJA|nr:NADH dehydrogenase subunit 6 [Tigriopus japonicus]